MSATREVIWILIRIACDLAACALAILPFLLLSLRQAEPFQRGFFCDDESIRYPYRPDSVSPQALFGGILSIPTGIILITELVRFIHSRESPGPGSSPSYSITRKCSIPRVLVLLYSTLGSMYFGFAAVLGLVDIGKFSAGRLRPHFFAVCYPDPKTFNCSSMGNTNNIVYVERFTCMGRSALGIWNARLSFPSGHAALSTYFAIFMLMYLEARLTWKPIRMLTRALQSACIAAAFYISISRVCDNAHHATDVIAGAIVGALVAIGTSWRVWRISRLPETSEKTDAGEKTEALHSVVNTNNGLCDGVRPSAPAFATIQLHQQQQQFQPPGLVSRVILY